MGTGREARLYGLRAHPPCSLPGFISRGASVWFPCAPGLASQLGAGDSIGQGEYFI